MKQLVVTLAKCLMIPLGMLHALLGKGRPAVSILMYHRIHDGVEKELSVKEADFRWQMDYLRRKGYRVISLDEALALPAPVPGAKEKYAVLTFDDGYEDFLTKAYPLLRQYRYPSIVYIVPGYIDTGKVFWWDRDIGRSSLLSWEQIGELSAGGLVQFGSHTMTHPDLDGLQEKEIQREMQESKESIQGKLQKEVRHFAYPRGIVTECALQSAARCYDTAVSIFEGTQIRRGGQWAKLRRLPVQRTDGRLLFGARLRGWLVAEGWLKGLVGRH